MSYQQSLMDHFKCLETTLVQESLILAMKDITCQDIERGFVKEMEHGQTLHQHAKKRVRGYCNKFNKSNALISFIQ